MTKKTFRYSDQAVDNIENIIDNSSVLEDQSDFFRTITDYTINQQNSDYNPVVENFERKVQELGLNELSDNALTHFDFAVTVHTVLKDGDLNSNEKIEYLTELTENEILSEFPSTDYASLLEE
jgi:hypothetical protein